MCWVCVGGEGGERVQLVEAVEPVYIFDPGTRGLNCSVEEKICRVLDRHRSPNLFSTVPASGGKCCLTFSSQLLVGMRTVGQRLACVLWQKTIPKDGILGKCWAAVYHLEPEAFFG